MRIRQWFVVLGVFLLLTPRQVTAQHDHHRSRAIEFPDVPGYETMKVDLHIHTVFSDGSVWPDIRVEEAVRDGLDAVAMTDHLEYQPHQEDIPHPDRNRSYQIARREAEDNDLLVLNGSEITRSMPPGHSNAIFVEDANRLLQDDVMAVFREAEEQGAFTFWNHPMWTAQRPSGIAALTAMHRELIEEDLLQGIEVANHTTYSAEALQIALEHDLTILGTSDIHGLIDWDYEIHHGGHRPVTLAFVTDRSKEGLKNALLERRTAVWFDDLLVGRNEQVVPLLEASLNVTDATYQEDTSVLDVMLENTSEASYVLQSRDAYTFHARGDVVTIEPHQTVRLQVKTGEQLESLELAFDVLNAVIAPEEHPRITFSVSPGN